MGRNRTKHTDQKENPMSQDPKAIAIEQLERLERAWNAADGAAYGASFTTDADFVDIRGDHHSGAVPIGHGHQAIFDTIYVGSTTRYDLDTARLVAPGNIVAVLTATLDAPSGPLRGVNRSRATAVLVQDDGEWRFTSFHNTLLQKAA